MSESNSERVFASYQEKWHGFDIYYSEDLKGTCLRYSCRVKYEGDHAFDLDGSVDVVTLSTSRPATLRKKDAIRELSVSRARAIIDLRSFSRGETLERSLDGPRTSDNPEIPDDELRRTLLEGFYVIWRALPRSYNTAEGGVDIDGLCMELNVSHNQYFSAIQYLLGKGCLQRLLPSRDDYSQLLITQGGIDRYESFRARTPTRDARIFVNYREKDTLADLEALGFRLKTDFGEDAVFIARGSIDLGAHSEDRIDLALDWCNAMLVLIGPKWLTIEDQDGRRRLDDPTDLLRREIEKALKRGILIIPVLVGGAHMPREKDLPNSLKELRNRQGRHIHEGHWERDTEELIENLEKALGLDRALLNEIVREEHGALFYIHSEGDRHLIRPDDDKTARFLRGPRGEISVSTEDLEPYPLGDPMESVLRCELLYVDPGPHIYALLNGKTYYVGRNDLDYWGRNSPEEWRHVTEQEFHSYPVGRGP